MKERVLLFTPLVLAVLISRALGELPEPGPVESGLRLRLVVKARPTGGKEGYEVRVDLVNGSAQPVLLRAHHWRSERHDGGFKEFVEAAVSIESYPEIEPWLGQVVAPLRGAITEPEYTLKPGEALSLNWRTSGRHLKNMVSNPLLVQNPEFTQDGLHSVHATIVLVAGSRLVRLLSNEQLVPIGGSQKMPKSTYGPLWSADEPTRTALLGLGALHKINSGDTSLIRSGIIGLTWTLTITNVEPDHAVGTLKPSQTDPLPSFPGRGSHAALIPQT
jgi:hypothetical protein